MIGAMGMGMGIGHWAIVVLVVTLLFGRGRISGLFEDVGKSVRHFRQMSKDVSE